MSAAVRKGWAPFQNKPLCSIPKCVPQICPRGTSPDRQGEDPALVAVRPLGWGTWQNAPLGEGVWPVAYSWLPCLGASGMLPCTSAFYPWEGAGTETEAQRDQQTGWLGPEKSPFPFSLHSSREVPSRSISRCRGVRTWDALLTSDNQRPTSQLSFAFSGDVFPEPLLGASLCSWELSERRQFELPTGRR